MKNERPFVSLARIPALALILWLGGFTVTARAQTTPWAEVGDVQLRHDVELLKAEGILKGPLLSWPLSFAELTRLEHAGPGLAPHVAHVLARVRRLAEASRARDYQAQVRTRIASHPRLTRDFGDAAREWMDVRGEAAWTAKHGFVRAGASVRSSQVGRDVQADRSLGALFWDDLHFYAGYVDHFWGPGQEGSLILSNAARPFPVVGIRRMGTEPFKSRWLRWIGRFRGELFVGMLDEKRDYRRALVVGMRLEFEPIKNLEIGLSRTLQMCGLRRPCGLGTWTRALIGVGDLDNTGTNAEPGNQLAAIDFRGMFKAFGVAFSLYGQALAEDEGTVMVYRFSQLWGVMASTGVSERGALGTLVLEFTDTRARDYLVAGERRPNTTYWHHIYRDGYTYHSLPLGFSLGGDALLGTLRGEVTDPERRRYWTAVRAAELNAYSTPTNPVSSSRERLLLLELGVDVPIESGRVHLEVRGQTDSPNTPGRMRPAGQVEVGYQINY